MVCLGAFFAICNKMNGAYPQALSADHVLTRDAACQNCGTLHSIVPKWHCGGESYKHCTKGAKAQPSSHGMTPQHTFLVVVGPVKTSCDQDDHRINNIFNINSGEV